MPESSIDILTVVKSKHANSNTVNHFLYGQFCLGKTNKAFITDYLIKINTAIYLPSYCPFFDPIELMFGNAKSRLQRNYNENSC